MTQETTETKPRVRSSKSRDARYYQAKQSLAYRWREVIRARKPLQDAFSEISTWIKSLDITISQRTSLHDGNWALRDFAVSAHSRWQLYLDGQPLTFDEIAAIADREEQAVKDQGPGPMHDAHIRAMRRICGRHEWDDTHMPFYSDEDPGLLST